MTFKEKLKIEHPDRVGREYMGGCSCCPCKYGYEKEQACKNPKFHGITCSACWNREIPETEPTKNAINNKGEERNMGLFSKKNPVEETIENMMKNNACLTLTNTSIRALDEAKTNGDEWTWVTGYKGTDKDMRCRDYQFTLDEQFDMPEGAKIELCESGFHFCRNLKSVFNYYDVDRGNRFFEVRALVRKKDYEAKLDHLTIHDIMIGRGEDKLAAKSIMFVRELTTDEVLKEKISADTLATWTEAEKKLCMRDGEEAVERSRKVTALTALGYSGTMASYIVDKTKKFDLALALISQDGLTMVDICKILFGKD